MLLEGLGVLLDGLRAILGDLGMLLRASWVGLGGFLVRSWVLLGCSWGELGASSVGFGPIRCDLERAWAALGVILGALGPLLGALGPPVGCSWRVVGTLFALVNNVDFSIVF